MKDTSILGFKKQTENEYKANMHQKNQTRRKSKSKDRDKIQAINSYAVLVTSYSSEIISYKKNEIAKFYKKDIVHIRWFTHKSRQ